MDFKLARNTPKCEISLYWSEASNGNNMTEEKLDKIGFIGLGQMGAGMASNLAKAGIPLFVYDISPVAISSTEALGALHGKGLASMVENCALIFICLPGEKEVENVLFGEGELTRLPGRLKTVVDASTISYTRAQEFSLQTNQSGIRYCDCPVSGLPQRAREGSLTMMFGGSPDDFKLATPYLNIMGDQVLYCGDIGSGQMAKAINNIIYNINIAGFCEVLPLAVKSGLDPVMLGQLLAGGSARSFASEHFVPRILEGKFDDDFPMQLAYKDILNVQKIANSEGVDTPMVNAMTALYDKTIDSGFGSEPKSAMIKVYEHLLGISVRQP
ncbi:MAG: NAD(P)-dependent oxidoreductase [bacterium]